MESFSIRKTTVAQTNPDEAFPTGFDFVENGSVQEKVMDVFSLNTTTIYFGTISVWCKINKIF